jgi:hypothetical protein
MQKRLWVAARFGLCAILSCTAAGSNETAPPAAGGGDDAASAMGTGGGGAAVSPPVDGNGVEVPKTQLGARLAVGPFSSCIIDDQTTVHCFGRCGPAGQGGSRDMAPAGLKAISVAVGRTFACALLVAVENGTVVRCWGGDVPALTPKIVDAVDIVAASDHACTRSATGAVTCWGAVAKPDAGATEPPPQDLVAKGLAASEAMDCAIGSDDAVRCWGPRPSQPPADLKAKRISVSTQLADPAGGPRYGCAVTLGDDVRCWGDDPGGVQTVPLGFKAKEIAVGRSAACAIALDGGIRCWGTAPRSGAIPPEGRKATGLSMAFRTAGAVLDDHSFVFWGDVSDGRGAPPAGVRAP